MTMTTQTIPKGLPAPTPKAGMPTGWTMTTLGEVAAINPTESIAKGEKAKYVPMEGIAPFTRQIASYEQKEFNGGMKFRNGDTLLARITPCLENGKTSFVDILEENEIGFGSTEYIVIREKKDLSDKYFLYYLATAPKFREIAIKAMTGTSGRQRVQTDLLISSDLFIPPLQEQKAIAAVLSALDDKIELLRKNNKTLEGMAQTLFKHWFVDFEFPNEKGKPYKSSGGKMIDSPLGEIPAGWETKGLSEIANFLNGLALQNFPPESESKYLPVVKIRELNSGITAQTDKASRDLDSKYIVDNGDILFSWSGSLELVIWKHGKGALNQHLFKVTSDKYPKWFYYLWTLEYLPHFRGIASGKATTMGHIQRHHLDEALVAIPPHELMKVADKLFTPLLDKRILNNNQIQTLSRLRDSLLPKLMKGELRLKGFRH